MLISALAEYYDLLQSENKLISEELSKVRISYLICLKPDGTVANIMPHKDEIIIVKNGKEKTEYVPREEIFPKRVETTTVLANVIEHRPTYIFGMNYDKTQQKYTTTDKTNKAQKSHDDFVEKQLEFLDGITETPLICAFKNFVQSWKPEEQVENPFLIPIAKEYNLSGFAFCLEGQPNKLLNDSDYVKDKWKKIYNSNQPNENAVTAQCAITGQIEEIARTHNNLKGIRGGQASGVNIVCCKESAYCSYSKEQSYNSNISKTAMEKYTKAFNYLTENISHHKVFDDMTVIYWAHERNEEPILNMFEAFAFGDDGKKDAVELDQELNTIIGAAQRGEGLTLQGKPIKEDTKFFIVGVVPNASRLEIKFFYQCKLGDIIQNVIQHQQDLSVNTPHKQLPVWRVLKELKSPKSSKYKVPTSISTGLFRAILLSSGYPCELMYRIVTRIKVDGDTDKSRFIKINDIRVGIIKAYLNRKNRIKKEKESITMALNESNTSPPYLCGRLFAVLEKVQKDIAPNLNKTIKDSYFSAACSTPSAVFSRLIKLSNYHLAKMEGGGKTHYNKLIGEIMSSLDGAFPKTLNLDQQGEFIVGYYQQDQML